MVKSIKIINLKAIYITYILEITSITITIQKIIDLIYASSLSYNSQLFKISIIYYLYYCISFFFSNSFYQNYIINLHHQNQIYKYNFLLLISQ